MSEMVDARYRPLHDEELDLIGGCVGLFEAYCPSCDLWYFIFHQGEYIVHICRIGN